MHPGGGQATWKGLPLSALPGLRQPDWGICAYTQLTKEIGRGDVTRVVRRSAALLQNRHVIRAKGNVVVPGPR
jgi:hypothetical protein